MSSQSITFGVLSRTSFEQMFSNIFTLPQERHAAPLPVPTPFVGPRSLAPPPPETKEPTNNRERCNAVTLESSRCKNWAKPTLSYCYTHRGLSSTKNTECPICLEKFLDPQEIFLLACAHQLHKACMAQLRTDTCPVCRGRLTNLPKDLNAQIRTRKIQDTTERNEEDLQDALHRLGHGMNMVFSPFLMAPREEHTDGQQIVWPALVSSYPSPISMADIFEDFIVRRNAEMAPLSE